MKFIATLIMALMVICQAQLNSQTNFQYALFKKKHSLKAEDLKAFEKDGKKGWTVKTTLTNRSRKTMYYFITNNCDQAYYSVDTNALFVDVPKCHPEKVTVIAIKPKQQRIVNLEINSFAPLTSSLSFRILMFIFTAKDLDDKVPAGELVKKRQPFIIVSNTLKT